MCCSYAPYVKATQFVVALSERINTKASRVQTYDVQLMGPALEISHAYTISAESDIARDLSLADQPQNNHQA